VVVVAKVAAVGMVAEAAAALAGGRGWEGWWCSHMSGSGLTAAAPAAASTVFAPPPVCRCRLCSKSSDLTSRSPRSDADHARHSRDATAAARARRLKTSWTRRRKRSTILDATSCAAPRMCATRPCEWHKRRLQPHDEKSSWQADCARERLRARRWRGRRRSTTWRTGWRILGNCWVRYRRPARRQDLAGAADEVDEGRDAA
jgi:hypothetical protein